MLLTVLGAAFLASIADLSGLFLFWKKGWAKKYSNLLVSFAAGALLAAAFLELLPEAIKNGGSLSTVLLGIIFFYLIERVIFLYHCHDGKCTIHTFSWVMLIGNTLHDFVDGVIIALAFIVDPGFGMVTALAVIAHEFPAGIGEFGVLIHGGFGEMRALFYTVLTILATPLWALTAWLLASQIEPVTGTLLALAAGGFIYIAAVDLIPETHQEFDRRRSIMQGVLLILGILVIDVVGKLLGR